MIHVVPDHEIDALLQTGATELDRAARRTSSATSVLARVADLAVEPVSVSTVLRQGEVARAVLDEAHAWRADLVIVGRSFRSISGSRTSVGDAADPRARRPARPGRAAAPRADSTVLTGA